MELQTFNKSLAVKTRRNRVQLLCATNHTYAKASVPELRCFTSYAMLRRPSCELDMRNGKFSRLISIPITSYKRGHVTSRDTMTGDFYTYNLKPVYGGEYRQLSGLQ